MISSFHTLSVSSIHRETPQAVTIALSIPESLQDTFRYRPGQYLTLKANINGEEVRRSYSFSSSPLESASQITVKEVPGGVMSTYLNRELQVGATIEVLPPQGRFSPQSAEDKIGSYFLFGGGSGITPLMSIAKTILHQEPNSSVFLLYGNREKTSTIFWQSLEALQAQYPQRFVLQHVWETVNPEDINEVWEGMMDAPIIHRFLNRYRPQHLRKEYFICGPSPMMDTIEQILGEKFIPKKSIHIEHFGVVAGKIPEKQIKAKPAQLTATLQGQTANVPIPAGKTVLDALLHEGYDIPFSCRSGTCSTCLGRCLEGQVEMRTNLTLEDQEVADGLVLTCQAVPTTEAVSITFDL